MTHRAAPFDWGTTGDAFRHFDAMEARLTAVVSERLLDRAGLHPGHRGLDRWYRCARNREVTAGRGWTHGATASRRHRRSAASPQTNCHTTS